MQQQKLYQQIFEPLSAGEHSTSFLEATCKKYPYFSVAHYYLLAQTNSSDAGYENLSAKAALHFTNMYLLTQRLDEQHTTPAIEEEVIEPDNTASEVAEVNEAQVVLPDQPTAQESIENTVENVANTPETTKEEGLLFEPLHTTDYFASQGIKLSDEVQPADKLGKQLKSFTEWLKTMKKVHDSKLPAGSDQVDASVNKLAEKSNIDAEIVTEAMAEAYLLQNKPEKAKDIYLKLSLLNPSKNTYFAAKIDQIVW